MFKDVEAFSSFSVNDLAQAKRFYGEILGLDVTDEYGGELLSLRLGGGGKVIVYPKRDHIPAPFTVLNFPVDDIDRAVDGLAERGVSFERYAEFESDERGIHRGAEGPPIAWFRDPAGNVLAVLEHKPG